MKLKLTTIIVAIGFVAISQTVVPYWKLGGNPILPGSNDGVNTTNNYLGTNAANNTFMKIGVQGSQDIMIDNDNTKLLPADVSGRLHGGHWIGMGRVFTPTNGPGAGLFAPKAHLHIDGGNNSGQFGSFGNGIRSWMNTGTLYTENSDAMYVGMKSISNNFSYAMINWSDDAFGGNAGSDFLSFNFTGAPGALAPTTDGMELGRFNPTPGRGTLGVGNFQFLGTSTEPVRRLEILDADPSNGINANTPQLRTTYTYNTTPTNGIFTEFQTTSTGDMYFNTRANTIARRFGFHDNTPGNTVEITANGSSPIPVNVNGTSGLRFTNMVAGNTPQTNPGAGVLSVNATGDVILVPDGGVPTANNGVSVNAGVVQLGVPCTLPSGFPNLAGIVATQLTTDRLFANRNQNFWIASLDAETGGVGIGGQPVLPFCGTGNTFEVSANAKNTKYGNIDASGVRLTKLLSTSPTIPNGTYGVNSSKVLTVDGDGDVVLTDAVNGNLGNTCGATQQNPLLNDWEIPMNGKNYTFSDPLTTLNYGQNTVRIGSACSSPLFNAKLEVIRNVTNIPANAHTLVGIASINRDQFPILTVGDKSYAGYFLSDGGSASTPINYSNYGVVGIAKNAKVNYGGYFEAKGTKSMNYGIYAKAISASITGGGSLAGYFEGDVIINGPFNAYNNQIFSDKNIKTAITPIKSNIDLINKLRPVSFMYDNTYAPQLRVDNNLSYGFIAQEVGAVLPELIKSINIPEELDTLGNVVNPSKALATLNYDGLIPFAIGGIQELNSKQKEMQASIDKINLSDAQVKTNVNTFNALATVKTLSPVKYNFTNANVPQLNFKSNTDYGFIAQQLETVYPELVDTVRVEATYDSLGVVVNATKVLKTVNYKAMSALLVRSIQEQQLTIDSLRNAHTKQDSINQLVQQQLAALASQINTCCANKTARNTNTTIDQLDIELSDKDAIVLNQNVPNPFAEQTTITFNVPASVVKAQLIFYNTNGQVIQTVDIKTRGKGKVNVFAADLSTGLYHYTLVADGKVADSKKMVRE